MKMQRSIESFTLALILIALAGGMALAHGPGMGGGYGHMYFDPDSIVDLHGVISHVYSSDWQMWGNGNFTGGGMGVGFTAADGTTYDLMLAPLWYLEEQGISLNEGDTISLRGSVIDNYYGGGMGGGMMGGQYPGNDDDDYLIVISLTAGGKTVTLRDANGYPVWRSNGGGMPWFDPDTVKTLKGTLKDSLGLWSCWGVGNFTGNGMHYSFESGGVSYYAMLAPWWYLEENGITVQDGDSATIKGSVVQPYWSGYEDGDYLIAMELTVGGKTVKLRDENGYPLWYGGSWYYVAPSYQKKTVERIDGIVARSWVRTRGKDNDPGLELVVKAGGKKYTVYLSPAWYAQEIGFSAAKGAAIQIRGSVIEDGGSLQIVAQSCTVGGAKTTFRGNDGSPRWVKGAK